MLVRFCPILRGPICTSQMMTYTASTLRNGGPCAFGERSALLLEQALTILDDTTAALRLQGDGCHMQTRAAIAADLDGARDDGERLAAAARWVDTLQAEIRRRQEAAAERQEQARWEGAAARAYEAIRSGAGRIGDALWDRLARWLPAVAIALAAAASIAAFFEATDPGSVLRWMLGLIWGLKQIGAQLVTTAGACGL